MMKNLLGNLLTKKLAKLFDKLRLASPIAYIIVSGVVIAAGEIVRANPDIIATFPGWFEYVVIAIEVITPVALSSRTKRHMPDQVEQLSEAQLKVLSTEQVKILQDYDD